MKRATTLHAWWYVVVGTVIAGSAAAPEGWIRTTVLLVAAALVVPAVIVAARRRLVPARVGLVVTAIVALDSASNLAAGNSPAFRHAFVVLAGIAAMCLTALVLALVLRHRGAPSERNLMGDAAIVALGTWMLGWVAFVEPLAGAHGPVTRDAVLLGLTLPAAANALFVMTAILLQHRSRQPALLLLAAALSANVLADVLVSMVDIGHLGAVGDRIAVPFHVLAYVLLTAALVHHSIAEVPRPQPVEHRPALGRLIVTTSSLMVPVIVVAATAPNSSTDRIVRTASAVVLALVVTLRVIQSVHANTRAHAELLRGAQTDPLTGLPNRTLLLERINDLMRGSWQPDHFPTLFYVDLDRFKNINDSLGHAAGDEVLVTVAQRLEIEAPEGATVARISGDEFVVLHPASESMDASRALAERLRDVFREPLALTQGDVFVTASIGVASVNATSATSAEDLVRHSDTAMYQAKDAGRNTVAVYDESMHERVAHRLEVETALYRALERDELRLYHQPILNLVNGEVEGFEALMRWLRSDGTIVSPAEFIPIAEDTGTIVPIGAWALNEALCQLRTWIDEGVCGPNTTMSVNVSPRQLSDPALPDIVADALTLSGVPGRLLWLEVTEGVMITEPELAFDTLQRLADLGARIALDDFGTGYSSLSLLQKFPLHRIKIDRAFVKGVAKENSHDESLVRTIVAMAASLKLDLVAEGVESVHQLDSLSRMGCHKAQGYLISHPVPADAMRTTVAALERLRDFPALRGAEHMADAEPVAAAAN